MHILSVHWQSVWLNLRLTSQRWGRPVALRTGGCCRTATFAKHRGSSRNAGPSSVRSAENHFRFVGISSREKPDPIALLASPDCGQASKSIRALSKSMVIQWAFYGFERRLRQQVLNEAGIGASLRLVCWVSVWPRLHSHVQTSFCLLFGIWAWPEAWPAEVGIILANNWRRQRSGNEASMVFHRWTWIQTPRKSIKVLYV